MLTEEAPQIYPPSLPFVFHCLFFSLQFPFLSVCERILPIFFFQTLFLLLEYFYTFFSVFYFKLIYICEIKDKTRRPQLKRGSTHPNKVGIVQNTCGFNTLRKATNKLEDKVIFLPFINLVYISTWFLIDLFYF